jgi:hypothetical protein
LAATEGDHVEVAGPETWSVNGNGGLQTIRFLDVETKWKILSPEDELALRPVLRVQIFAVLPDIPIVWESAG